MEIKTVYAVYFSATGRTRKGRHHPGKRHCADAGAAARDRRLHPACRAGGDPMPFTDKDLVIFGTPTYAGKVPNKLLPFVQTGLYRKRRACRAGRDLRQPQL